MSKALRSVIEAIDDEDEDFIRSDDWINAWQVFHPEPDEARSNGTAALLRAWRAYAGSLDEAKEIHEALLPEWTLNALQQIRHPGSGMKPTGQWEVVLFAAFPGRFAHASAKASDPARAWLLAILRAKGETP